MEDLVWQLVGGEQSKGRATRVSEFEVFSHQTRVYKSKVENINGHLTGAACPNFDLCEPCAKVGPGNP